MDILVTDFSLRLCNVHLSLDASVGDLTQVLSRERGVPHADFYVKSNGRLLGDDEKILPGALYRLEPRLRGGKGGFGSMLRALGAQIEKTTNREACRDLSGRRLRDVNHEKEMADWLKKQADREAEKEQRRIERLQRKLAEPKHYFNDPEYDKQCQELSERMEESIKKGLQASSSGPSGVSRKRTSPYGADPGKRKCMWMSGLEGVSSSEDESGGSDVEAPPSTSISPERRSAALGRGPSEGTSTSAALGRVPAEASSTSAFMGQVPAETSSSSSSSSSSPQRSPAEPTVAEPVGEAEPVAVADGEAEPVAVADGEAEPVAVAEGKAEPVAEAEPEREAELEPVAEREAEPVTEMEVEPVAVAEGKAEPEPEREAELEPVAEREAELAPVAEMEVEPVAVAEGKGKAELEPVAEREAAAPGSSGSVETQQNIALQRNSEETSQPENTATPPADAGPLDLQASDSAVELEALGMERLKVELMERGLKCGGMLQERAARLFSIRGLAKDQIPPALLAKPGKGKKK